MNSRQQIQSMLNNSVAIRQEIQRFESVHPSIYAIYDLIELIPDTLIAQQIRDHVVCIEDSFVNSQEWTVARAVPDLRLGIVGALSSGKSALVHRYLTGSYMQEESPEGGRFKKEVVLDGQSHLLLIRDEGGAPEHQFSSWVDAVIFVFSLESEASFNAIYGYYTKMAHFRNSAEVPLILVGTQDAISETNPRVIDDARARKLAADLKRCSYYETCATYGLNVERVFQDACHKIVQQRLSQSTTCLSTPVGSRPTTPVPPPSAPAPALTLPPATQPQHHSHTLSHKESGGGVGLGLKLSQALSSSSHQLHKAATDPPQPPTPSSTPTATRKNRRRSNLFTPSKKAEERVGRGGVVGGGGEVGVGRAIPLKQGYLYKRSSKALNKEWKKKYVTLCDDGRLTYHPSLHDYMDDVHGKEISLQYVTVKVPGQRPRGSSAPPPPTNGHHPHPNPTIADSVTSLTITSNCYQTKEKRVADKVLLTAYELLREPGRVNGEEPVMLNNALYNGIDSKAETPNVKKRHRRVKSSIKNQECEDSDGFEFLIVSLDNKQWQFEASNSEERDDWVAAIEQQILNSLQGNESSKAKTRLQSSVESAALQTIRDRVPGNTHCVDCDAPNPEWASLNLGVVMCIECCGVHRNLGSHISRVRSLHLDEWPPGHLAVMLSVGNAAANRVWEGQGAGGEVGAKPTPSSSREEKDRWIRAKYEARAMLPPMPPSPAPHRQLVFAVCRNDMWSLLLLLAHGGADLVNAAPNEQTTTTALHLACAAGNLAVAQLLIWYNANVKAVDKEGRTCLGLARAARAANPSEQSGALVELLQSLGCPEQATNLTQIRHSVPTLDNLQASVI